MTLFFLYPWYFDPSFLHSISFLLISLIFFFFLLIFLVHQHLFIFFRVHTIRTIFTETQNKRKTVKKRRKWKFLWIKFRTILCASTVKRCHENVGDNFDVSVIATCTADRKHDRQTDEHTDRQSQVQQRLWKGSMPYEYQKIRKQTKNKFTS